MQKRRRLAKLVLLRTIAFFRTRDLLLPGTETLSDWGLVNIGRLTQSSAR